MLHFVRLVCDVLFFQYVHSLTTECLTQNDYFVSSSHEMTKEHYIGFVAYVRFDKVLTVRLYPEQDATVRFPKMYGGKLYYLCNTHGLFELKI